MENTASTSTSPTLTPRSQFPSTTGVTAAPQARTRDELESIFAAASSSEACALAAEAFVKDQAHLAPGTLTMLCSRVPAGDHLAAVCGRIADGLGSANVRKAECWKELLQVAKLAQGSPEAPLVLNACAQHLARLKLDDPVLWNTLLDALPDTGRSREGLDALAVIAKAMMDAGVDALATWSQLMDCAATHAPLEAGAPYSALAASLAAAGVTCAPAWTVLHEHIGKSHLTPEEKTTAAAALASAFLSAPIEEASVLSQLAQTVGWPTVLRRMDSIPLKTCAILGGVAPPTEQKRIVEQMVAHAEKAKSVEAMTMVIDALIDLKVTDAPLWTKSLTAARGLPEAQARALCVKIIPFIRNTSLLRDQECRSAWVGLRESVDHAYSWSEMMQQAQTGPRSQAGWPSCAPMYKFSYDATVAGLKPRTDDQYKAPIIANGKLLVGDIHNVPEGTAVLCHMLNALPVEGLFLEENVMSVLANAEFMAWIKAHPDASPKEALDKAMELCCVEEPPASPMLRGTRRFGMDLLTLGETADTWLRWLELQRSVARFVTAHDIPVHNLFNTPELIRSAEPRVLDQAAWQKFNSPTAGKVNVFLGGTDHIIQGNAFKDPETHDLLKKSDGLFAQPVISHQAVSVSRMQSPFFMNGAKPSGSWSTQLSVNGVSSTPSVSPQGEPCVHGVVFSLYAKQPFQ